MTHLNPLLADGTVRLRAPEPADLEALLAMENDTSAWDGSATYAPMSRRELERYIECYTGDILADRQLRLVIAAGDSDAPLGILDLYDYDPLNRRAAVGIIVGAPQRRRGIARRALAIAAGYARRRLGLEQLWCHVAADNLPSLALFAGAGYETAGTLRRWLRREDRAIDVKVMQRILPPPNQKNVKAQ